MDVRSFGYALRSERVRRGLTQEQFAAIGGVKRLSQHHYEQGTRAPDVNYLLELAYFGVDIAALLDLQRPSPQAMYNLDTVVEAYRVVDEMGVDSEKRPLPVDERARLFRILVGTLAQQEAMLKSQVQPASKFIEAPPWPPPGTLVRR